MSVQFIKSARRGKPITWYVYAFKGGSLILKHIGPKRPKLSASHWRQIEEAIEQRNAPPSDCLRALIWEWRSRDPQRTSSPEWEALAESTKTLWGAQLDLIDARWGDKPISVWNDPRMVAKVVKWRDERASSPRSADIGITVLRALLEFGRLRGGVAINVAANIPRLYKGGNCAEIVRTDDDMAAFKVAAEAKDWPQVYDGLRLASLTGLRRADLLSLTWDNLGDYALVKTALKKSGGRRRKATIPLTDELRSLLDELKLRPRGEGVKTVLVNSRGQPWTPSGFTTSFSEIRNKANIKFETEDQNGNIIRKWKHLHDVRGTFCTLLLTEFDLTDREAADIMA